MSFEQLLSRKPSSLFFNKNSSSPGELYTSDGSLLQQQNEKLFTIAVVGINKENEQKLGRGVGKSCFCNRVVRPHADSYRNDHISTISTVDFNGRVINGDHWLYWGDRVLRTEEHHFTIRVVEQTEFLDDVTFQSLNPKEEVYTKRCSYLKLQSVEKLMYICKDQLGFENDYEQKQLPENRVQIDGFICLLDVTKTGRVENLQIFQDILQNLCKTKKPILILTSKNDELSLEDVPKSTKMVEKFLSSKKEFKHLASNIVEISSHWNINIDLSILCLINAIDRNQKLPSKIASFKEALHFKENLCREFTQNFMNLLQREIRDLNSNWERAKMRLINDPDYENFVEFIGGDQASNCFNRFLRELSDFKQKRRFNKQIGKLPKILSALQFRLSDVNGKPWSEILNVLESCQNFGEYFFDDRNEILQQDSRLSIQILFTKEAEEIFRQISTNMEENLRRRKLLDEFGDVLANCGQVTPGKPLEDVKLFLVDNPCYEKLNENDVIKVYDQYQRQIIRNSRRDFAELLLENVSEFRNLNFDTLNQNLSDDFRYRRLNKLRSLRDNMIWQTANFLQNPKSSCCPAELRCLYFTLEEILDNYLNDKSLHRANSTCDVNLLIVDLDGMGQNFVEETGEFLGDDDFTVEDVIFRFNYTSVNFDDGGLHFLLGESQSPPTPDGVIFVFSCRSSLQKLENFASTLHQYGDKDVPKFYLVLACDPSNLDDLPYLQQHAALNFTPKNFTFFGIEPSRGVVTAERRARSVNSYFTDGQIRRILESASSECKLKNCASKSVIDLNLALCLTCGDSFTLDGVLRPFLNCCRNLQHDGNSFIFEYWSPRCRRKTRCKLEIFAYHDLICKFLRPDCKFDVFNSLDGLICLYDCKRKASLAHLNFLTQLLVEKRVEITSKCLLATVGDVADLFTPTTNDQKNLNLINLGDDLASKLGAKFTVLSPISDQQMAQYATFLDDCSRLKNRTSYCKLVDKAFKRLSVNSNQECQYMTVKDALAESNYEQKLIENEAQYATIESLWNNESGSPCKVDMNFVPPFVQKCVEFIERRGMDTEGLYRIPGNQNQAQDLEQIFQRNCYMADFDTLHFPVCVVTTALKNYIAGLKQSLVPSTLHGSIVEIMDQNSTTEEKLRKIEEILSVLSIENRSFLKYLLSHLSRIAENSANTSMDSRNLAKCWWPTILRPEFDNFKSMAISTHKFENFLYFLLQNFNHCL